MVADTKLDGSKVANRMAKTTKTTKSKRKKSAAGKAGASAKVAEQIESNSQLKTTLQQIETQFGEG